MEILSPAGSKECIFPAVRMGADAIYLGASMFSARASATNFSNDELKETIDYCHARGVKVYLALNTLMRDDELENAMEVAKFAVSCNIDAIIVQDLGLAYLLRKACPNVRLHASTQMSIHTPEGAKLLYELGFSRVVLSRELSVKEIKEIVDSCPIETEVFVHGALCMSVSGQCYFSAMAGSRSGNRGKCAQPCRLPFNINGKKDNTYALSLKDLSIVKHLHKLEEIGVTSAKIEGRMKRPEYVAMAVHACKEYLKTGEPPKEVYSMLEAVFSRSGFTDGYYTGKTGKEMFGTRLKENVLSADNSLFKKIRAMYDKEQPLIKLSGKFTAITNTELSLELHDDIGNSVKVTADAPELAINSPINEERAIIQLKKTGGTPFYIDNIEMFTEGNPAVSVSQLNFLRREALEKLINIRINNYKPLNFTTPNLAFNKNEINPTTIKRYSVYHSCNIDTKDKTNLTFIPWNSSIPEIKRLVRDGYNIGIELPRGMFGSENAIRSVLIKAKEIGVTHILTGNLGGVALAKNLGFIVHGDFGLNIMNSFSILQLKELGVSDTVVSIELTFSQIKNLVHHIPLGILSEGYIPLMLTRNCPAKLSNLSCNDCKKQSTLTDRTGRVFPLICNNGCTEILNCVPLRLDYKDILSAKPDFEILRTDIGKYISKNARMQGRTRGLYNRGVE